MTSKLVTLNLFRISSTLSTGMPPFLITPQMMHPQFSMIRSLSEGIFPTVWKTCSITPILKSGDPSDVSNYRPISILPHLAKLFESIIYCSIKRSLNHIIHNNQHGFGPGKSTVTISLSFTSYILDNLETGSQVDAIFTDFKKAFDTVDHGLLIDTIDKLSIDNLLLSWLGSYLTSRRQFVSIGGAHSDLVTIPSGEPQGGHLSPHLSLILLFADDIKLYLKINSTSDCHTVQSDLDTFSDW
ncbi:PREDICTED: RNA-directed DNA polymerase from mobile element jockey-like, partial [Diuraphis noxia]|uniref:RNA-directed DNA polymerase from mobile element jockey-like n=1 Tax=Diuraphis noxia TaxID=143948 RepID=UPI000763B216